MNPLLSLSFASSGSVAAGAEPAAHHAEAAMDQTTGAQDFGRLLNQSGEQQTTGRQSFAGFNISAKGKRAASMEGLPAGRPQDKIPPVISPDTELSQLADADNEPGTLLGMLDLASQTRLQLTAGRAEKGKAAAEAATDPGTTSGADSTTLPDGKKVAKGEWFILPVYPELANADAVDHDAPNAMLKEVPAAKTAAGNLNQSSAEQAAATALAAAGKNAAAGDGSDGTTDDKLNPNQHNNQGGKVLAQQALANQASDADTAVAQHNIIAGEADVTADRQSNADESGSAGLSDKFSATSSGQSNDEKIVAASPAASVSSAKDGQSTVSAEIEAELAARQLAIDDRVATDPELTAELQATAQAGSAAVKSAAANPSAEPERSGVEAPELQKATASSKPTAATIFDNADKTTVVTADAKPGSVLASAAAVAESLLAKQAQGGAADSATQTKQTQGADTDTGGQQTKADLGAAVSGVRADSSLSGFGTIASSAGQSQSEAILARLDAATVTGSQQTAERAKAQSVNKSVTEQLKQVNLLAQNAAGQLKERINLMVRQNIHVAEIRLDPADLGQMQIRVNLQQEQASVQFIVQQQHAKELLEQQMPRLREMLQQQGIQLGEGHVQQQRQGDSQTSGRRDGHTASGQSGNEQLSDEQATVVQLDVKLSERIVDYYA
ncbi:flagellar hook-length control protein FliK [Arsukibacterium sp.]|uniref:flagellar hook-length control protein FliK n=1 Tax=Arsukibacterium sp. TaxID=1977258 RepID=UPI001BD699DB|nr:flagellar hook-length control protein FliK [Arsukibacterium sp.]